MDQRECDFKCWLIAELELLVLLSRETAPSFLSERDFYGSVDRIYDKLVLGLPVISDDLVKRNAESFEWKHIR